MEQPGGPAVAQSQSTAGGSGDQPKKPRHPPPANRKRTKTGCLTCRKRRIKCDEARPTCNNCIKSKRICEGYNQRVIFKDPIGAHPFAGPFGAQGYIQGAAHTFQLASQQARRPGTTGLAAIAPRPPANDFYAYLNPAYTNPLPPGFPGSAAASYDYTVGTYPPADSYIQQRNPLAVGGPIPQPQPQPQPLNYYIPPPQDEAQPQRPPQHHQFGPQGSYPPQYPMEVTPEAFTPNPPGQPLPSRATEAVASLPAQEGEGEFNWSDEDASIVDSDDEAIQHQGAHLINMLQSFQNRGFQYSGPSYWNRSANDYALGQYMSTPHADELKSEVKRKLFEHFMRVTGPTMSLYERHPFDPAEKREVSNNSQVPRETKGDNIWSHTFPMLSLQHPGLLHAILALASLQICHIQGTPATAAHKHYHVAIRRIAKNVKSETRRLHPATLAATLLLCYFEVWNSEHTRWASHLYGARTLFAEMPLRNMGRRCLPAQSLRVRQALASTWNFPEMANALPEDPDSLNFDLLTAITGSVVRPEDYCLNDAQVLGQTHDSVSDKDIEKYENLRDLFWWYCKMDVYQTMLGGTKLFMDYRHWTQCPPRAPVSRLSGIYGTYDHLMLLLGRLAHFASNDLPRKRRVSRAKGPPPPGSSSPPPFPGMLPTQGTFRAPMGFSPPRTSNTVPDQQEDLNPHESYERAVAEWKSIKEAFETLQETLGPEFQPLSREYSDLGDPTFGHSEQYRTFSVAGIWMNFYMGLIQLHRSHPNMPPTAMQSVGFAAHTTAPFAKRIGRIAIGLAGNLSSVNEVNTVLAAALVESAFCLFVAAVQYQDDAQRQWVVQWMHNITRLTGWKSARQIADGCESAWTKAAHLGKGPPYERHYEPHETMHTHESVWDNARRIDRVIQEIDYDGGANDRRIVVARAERAHYALGLLGVEDDMEYLELKDETFNRGLESTGQGQ